jgi:spore germination cell wall hydrolase CwlJ-like protein
LKPWQFSCWNEGDPNRKLILAIDASEPSFRVALDVAGSAVAGTLADPTGGSDHYYNWRTKKPKWAEGVEPAAVIGSHAFYRLGPNA